MDFTTILGGLAVAGLVTAIIAGNTLKASPNFANWASRKLATLFR